MPLISLIIGLIVVGVPLWLTFVFVVVKIQSSDPGEALCVDESVARSVHAVGYVTAADVGNGHDSVSKGRADFVAGGQQSLGARGSGISTVSQEELNPVASNETDYGSQQDRRVAGTIFPKSSVKTAAENG